MTKILLQLQDIEEIEHAYAMRAEIVVLSMDLYILAKTAKIFEKFNMYTPDYWLILDDISEYVDVAIKEMPIKGIVLALQQKEDWLLLQKKIKQFKACPIIVLCALTQLPNIQDLKTSNIAKILLLAADENQHFLAKNPIASLVQFFKNTHEIGLEAGILGHFESPDIPRLLPLNPNFIGFYGSMQPIKSIRVLLPMDSEGSLKDRDDFFGTDRIIIQDFILPIEIGAYRHEYGHTQNVRFNVLADVMRLSHNPEDMSHIFSYDIILDGIRNIASHGHVVLVETLAERIAAFILSNRQVQKVTVRVEKLDLGPAAVGIEIERTKKDYSI